MGGDIVLGVTTKTGEKDGNDTGSFPVTIADNKTTKEDKQLKIKLAYTDDSARDITTDIGSAVVGDGTKDPAQALPSPPPPAKAAPSLPAAGWP